jgi:hypothetical protein
LLVYGAWRTGVTVDEPGHLVSARLYWQGADRLRPGDMPPLLKIVAGWVPARFNLPLPQDLGKAGETRHEWETSLWMMERLKWEIIQPLYFYTRLPMTVFPLLSIALIWWWARQLFSPAAALASAALFAFEPTALAHGSILKNDHAATFAYLSFWFCAWRYWRKPSLASAALAGAGTALCLLAKLSLLFIFGLAPLVLAAGDLRARRFRWRTVAACLLACGIAYGLLATAVQFQMHRLTIQELAALDANRFIPRGFASLARVFTWVPVPDRMWAGTVTLVSSVAAEMPVYLLGTIWPHGNPFYFLVCLLVKAPVTLLILGAGGLGLLVTAAMRGRLDWADLLWILPGPLYVALASRVPLQLGVRLILPALPFGILLAGWLIEWLRARRWGLAALAVLLALFAFESARIYPNGIAFFNIAAGGPDAGFRYLADSNLDWGQGLGELARWARAHRAIPIRLSYFGTDMMFRYFRGNEVIPISPPWAESLVKGPAVIPEPGHYYAISATLLPGQFFTPKYRNFYGAFRSLQPVARPGYSIFVYRVGASTH